MNTVRRINHAVKMRRDNESGNIFIFMFGLILVMTMFLGLAVDVAGMVNARQGVQNTLTSATVAGATQMRTDGTARIDPAKAKEVAMNLYQRNRANVSYLRCAVRSDVPAGAAFVSTNGCPFVMTEFKTSNKGRLGTASITMSVRECSPTFFLTPVLKEFCYNVSSTGRVAASLE